MCMRIPVLCAQSQASDQDVRDEAHEGDVEVRGVDVEAGRHRSVLLVAHLPVLQQTSSQSRTTAALSPTLLRGTRPIVSTLSSWSPNDMESC